MAEMITKKVLEAIDSQKTIRVRLFALLQHTEQELNSIVTKILEKYNRADLLGAVYTSVKELALNGAKANIKRILFSELEVNPDDEESYSNGMKVFKSKLTEEFIAEYATKAKDSHLYVDVTFDFSPDRLIIEVVNNSAMSEKEDLRVREKFLKGSKYDNIAEYYLDMQDNVEGAGMGIILILMLLKAEGIDPHSFTVQSDNVTKTLARMEIPLSKEHVSTRSKFQKEEN